MERHVMSYIITYYLPSGLFVVHTVIIIRISYSILSYYNHYHNYHYGHHWDQDNHMWCRTSSPTTFRSLGPFCDNCLFVVHTVIMIKISYSIWSSYNYYHNYHHGHHWDQDNHMWCRTSSLTTFPRVFLWYTLSSS